MLFAYDKVFLDCGAFTGFITKRFRLLHKDFNAYYCFEPNPSLQKSLKKLRFAKVIQKAVWVEDGKADFHLQIGAGPVGSSLFADKITGGLGKRPPIQVVTLDFSKWVAEHLTPRSYIVLKMDIEGAEYDVLEKMHKDNTLSYINELFIEFHVRKIPSISQERHRALLNILKEYDMLVRHNKVLRVKR